MRAGTSSVTRCEYCGGPDLTNSEFCTAGCMKANEDARLDSIARRLA